MSRIDLIKKTPISASGRARQLEAMFDVPRKTESIVEWHGDLPIDDFAWNNKISRKDLFHRANWRGTGQRPPLGKIILKKDAGGG